LKKKLSLLLTGTVLSAMVLSGCNNDDRKSPMRVNTPDYRNINQNLDNLDRNNNKRGNINRDDLNDRDNINNNYRDPSKDKNTDTDKDIMKDRNTKQEDIIEDDIDVKDRDRKDE
jgi:outer membrane murein-binding lipoprotein Lpp